jgi:hypothetical protein
MEWILVLIAYLMIGVGFLVYIVKTDKYGGFVLHFWWLVIFFYPYLLVRNIFSR